jgi:pimeloyl-ACP methyl ester carboxylesterase
MPPLVPKDGFVLLDKSKFHEAFAADVPADKAALMADAQTPWGTEAVGGVVTEPAWKSKQSWYLVGTEDRMIPAPAQRQMAQRAGATIVEASGSHSIFVSQPQKVADLIKQASQGKKAAVQAS